MKKVFQHLQQNWIKYGFESVAVLVSILAAFALNNWNEARKENKIRDAIYIGLLSEFQQNYEQIQKVLQKNEEALTTCYTFIDMIKNPPNWQRVNMDSMMNTYGSLWTFDPVNGVLRSGISSGEIHLIQNDSLLNLLFSWQDIVKDSDEEEIRANNNFFREVDHLEKYVQFINAGKYYLNNSMRSAYASRYSELFKWPYFENIVTERLVDLHDLVLELKVLKQENEKIISLLTTEIEDN